MSLLSLSLLPVEVEAHPSNMQPLGIQRKLESKVAAACKKKCFMRCVCVVCSGTTQQQMHLGGTAVVAQKKNFFERPRRFDWPTGARKSRRTDSTGIENMRGIYKIIIQSTLFFGTRSARDSYSDLTFFTKDRHMKFWDIFLI